MRARDSSTVGTEPTARCVSLPVGLIAGRSMTRAVRLAAGRGCELVSMNEVLPKQCCDTTKTVVGIFADAEVIFCRGLHVQKTVRFMSSAGLTRTEAVYER